MPHPPPTAIRIAAAIASLFMTVLMATASIAAAREADGPAGIWWAPDHDAKIEIVVDAAGVASGRIIAVPRAHADERDMRNPDPALRARPVLGLTIINGFRQEKDGTWSGGTVYDPEGGRTYRGTLALDREGRLRLRGYVGLALFGRTEILTRVVGPSPDSPQRGEPDLVHLAR